jgi:hypothetical protein
MAALSRGYQVYFGTRATETAPIKKKILPTSVSMVLTGWNATGNFFRHPRGLISDSVVSTYSHASRCARNSRFWRTPAAGWLNTRRIHNARS